MTVFIRLAAIWFVVLTIVYFSVSLYSRAVRRGKLEAEWLDSDQSQTLDEHMRDGMTEYDSSLRKKLILLIYIVPTTVVAVIIYLTNFS